MTKKEIIKMTAEAVLFVVEIIIFTGAILAL